MTDEETSLQVKPKYLKGGARPQVVPSNDILPGMIESRDRADMVFVELMKRTYSIQHRQAAGSAIGGAIGGAIGEVISWILQQSEVSQPATTLYHTPSEPQTSSQRLTINWTCHRLSYWTCHKGNGKANEI